MPHSFNINLRQQSNKNQKTKRHIKRSRKNDHFEVLTSNINHLLFNFKAQKSCTNNRRHKFKFKHNNLQIRD